VLGGTSHRRFDDAFAENGAADTGEGVDRASLLLPGDQDALLATLRGLTVAPLVSVVVTGRPYVLAGVVARSDATLFCAYPGPEGADAIAAVLCGNRQPTGRLAAALPAHPGTVPAHGDDRHPAAGVYRDAPEPELFPLGHGLGYAGVELIAASADADAVRVELAATPGRGWAGAAEELVLVFARRDGSIVVPRRAELLTFGRVTLPPDGRTTLVLDLPAEGLFVPAPERAPLAETTTTLTVAVGAQRRTLTIRPPLATRPTEDSRR
jgi:beta-glucosidase